MLIKVMESDISMYIFCRVKIEKTVQTNSPLCKSLFVSFLKPSCYITFVFVAFLKFASLCWLLNCAKKMFQCHAKFSELMTLKLFFVVELKTYFYFYWNSEMYSRISKIKVNSNFQRWVLYKIFFFIHQLLE